MRRPGPSNWIPAWPPARFAAPWSLSGSAWASGPGRRRFELRFEFANPQADDPQRVDTITFSGGQDYLQDDFPVHWRASLDGWNLQWLSREQDSASWCRTSCSCRRCATSVLAERQSGASSRG